MSTVETEARVATILPRDLREELERLARENERTLSGEFRLAIREHLERHAAAAAGR